MTVKELYERALEDGAEDNEIWIRDSETQYEPSEDYKLEWNKLILTP